jgi:AcrR family transcriptional regulator
MVTSASRAQEQRVVEGARRAIELHGWQGATLARIAEEARLSRMTLYRRGLGREEILALLVDAYERDFRESLEPAVAGRGTGLKRLRRALLSVCEVTERHLAFLRGLDEETDQRFFHERAAEVRSREAYVSPFERVLEEGMRDGSIRRVDVRETSTLLVNAVDRTYRHLRIAHGWPPARARRALLDLLARGVAKDGDGHSSS